MNNAEQAEQESNSVGTATAFAPAVFVIADRNGRLDHRWLESLRAAFPESRIFSRPRVARQHGLDGLECDPGNPSSIAAAIAPEHRRDGLLILAGGLVLPALLRRRLAGMVEQPDCPDWSVFAGNYDPRVNPLAGFDGNPGELNVDALVAVCADHIWTSLEDLPTRCCFLKGSVPIDDALDWAGHKALADHFFVVDPDQPINHGDPLLKGARAGLGHLRSALRGLWQEGIESLPIFGAETKPVTLHVTHSWGGGTARWIADQVRHDDQGLHLVLCSSGNWDGLEHGQSLQLYAEGPGRGLIREFVLTPPIADTVDKHDQYREVFAWILARFGIGRIFVSSLIGHALECLRTGLPTAQVFHDFYPASPVLDVDPLKYIDGAGRFQMQQALEENRGNLKFLAHTSAYWLALRDRWLHTVIGQETVLIAPSRHVAKRWQRLGHDQLPSIHVIAHGFQPAWSETGRIVARRRPDGRLNLVVIGRQSAGKGLKLLQAVLDRIDDIAHITLIGAGKQAEAVFGARNVDVILQYDADELPQLLQRIGPDAALFLSTVPETWNYVLSEVRSLGIVPIATRVGSFPERIADRIDGVLFDPEPDALVAILKELVGNRSILESLAGKHPAENTLTDALTSYRERLAFARPGETESLPLAAMAPLLPLALADSADQSQAIEKARRRLRENLAELDRRADWAMRQKRLVEERTRWAQGLEHELERVGSLHVKAQTQIKQLEELLAERTRWAKDQERIAIERTEWARRIDQELTRAREVIEEYGRRTSAMEVELAERAEWAMGLQKQVDHLAARIEAREQALEALRRQLAEVSAERQRLYYDTLQQAEDIRALAERNAMLDQHLAIVLNSLSWRLTRPVRFLTRAFRKSISNQLWNPLRWPALLALLVHNLRTTGLRGTLAAIHHLPLPVATLPASPGEDPENQPFQSDEPDREMPAVLDQDEIDEPIEVLESPVSLVEVECPVVSIVIPVFNKVELTAACLVSIAETPSGVPFEVVVVDDCSTDKTAQWLATCAGITVIRNEINSGFIDSCNRGAAKTRGEFVIFLNNDTTVTAGWLDALVAPFHEDPDVGIVGARLVYPDGQLQEVGGIIFNDASGWNYGRNQQADLPQYSFVSEADYVSGACLAIRKADFESLGGFDVRYRPAYYEDTDLCFQVRAMGKKVIVQPAATIVHHEGATSGTDESSGTKKYQAVNRDKFREKWADVLATHPPSEPNFKRADPVRQLRYRRLPKRLFLIDAVTPQPDHDSGSVRIVAMMTLLRDLGYQVTFMAENRLWVDGYSAALQQAGIEVLCAPQVSLLEPWLAEHGRDLDLIIVSRHYVLAPILEMIRELSPQARLVFDTVDLHFLREEREAEVTGSAQMAEQASATREQELMLIRQSDITLVVSPVEQALLSSLEPEADIRVVSNIHSVHGCRQGWAGRAGLVFVGGFQHIPNIDAARWLVDEIFPLVRAEIPDIELHLIGSRMPDDIRAINVSGVHVHGFVQELDPYLDGCRVSVAPLRYGAGVKGKVNQAMSHGLPVVATTCAAEGMFLEHGRDVLVADTAEDFARQVIRAHQDQATWETLSIGGLKNVEQYFSRQAARRALIEIDAHVISKSKNHLNAKTQRRKD
jgi:O-antigen biosynthesis protein